MSQDDEVGTVADEAAKLFAALGDWAKDHGSGLGHGMAGLADQAARSARDVDEHLATGSAECTWCPLCRTVHALRHTNPEVRAHLSTAATSLLLAVAGLLATPVPRDRDTAGVQHIDLDEGPDAWPEDIEDRTGPEEGDR